MPKFKVTCPIEKEFESNSEEEAIEAFFEELETSNELLEHYVKAEEIK